MNRFKEVVYVKHVPRSKECLLGADIGGTNSNFGIFERAGDNLILLFSVHFKSKEVTDFTSIVVQVLEHAKKSYDITIKHSCFAAAGVVSSDQQYSKPTNVDLEIDAKKIREKTNLCCAFIVNDFEVIGYGVEQISPKSLVKVNKGKEFSKANQAILGAGTGLGKCIMDWNKYAGRYIPIASEGGHADFAPQNVQELDLIMFIRESEGFSCNVSWEDVLSGQGIQRIYRFFVSREKHGKSSGHTHEVPHPDEIFNSRLKSAEANKTFELYTKLYARCAKNFALDALALNGVYIAGGIAAKNLPMFELPVFMKEFVNCGKQQQVLQDVPIYVITDYNVSLYGAAAYIVLENMCNG